MSEATGTPGFAPLRCRTLGPLELYCGDRKLDSFRQQARKVLVILIARRGKPVTMAEIIDLVWPRRTPGTAPNMVHNCISDIRSGITLAGGKDPVDTIGRREGYSFDPEAGDFDDRDFTGLIEDAREASAIGDLEAARARYRNGLALWRGDEVMGGLPLCPEAITEELEHLTELRMTAAGEWYDVSLALGRHRDAVPLLRQLARAEPMGEFIHGKLMLAEYQTGRPDRAWQVYDEFCTRSLKTRGTKPGASMRRLHEQISSGDPALDPPIPAVPARPPRDRAAIPVQPDARAGALTDC